MHTVYLHISPNGKRYYGATSREVERRWVGGRGYKKNDRFWEGIQKYGWNNFQHIIVARYLTKDEAYWLEEELIREWNTTNPDKGYNITNGGPGANGLKHSIETRKKMSGNHVDVSGENHPMYGKHHTIDIKNRLSKVNKGKNNPMAKSVICLTTKRIFFTAREGSKYYNCNYSNISQCCQGKFKSAGKLNGQRLVWRYLVWNHNKKYRINKEKW